MILKRVEISDLLDRGGVISARFHPDLNIITGRNGAGKTSFLKIVWYVISGNILQALTEVPFQRILVETSTYTCIVHRLSKNTCRIELTVGDNSYVFEDQHGETSFEFDGPNYESAEDQAAPLLIHNGSSLFFPTFRRIEGGFSLSAEGRNGLRSTNRQRMDIENALEALSRKLSNQPHVFVAAISTIDVVSILLRQYAELSESSTTLQQKTSVQIINRIKEYKSDEAGTSSTDGEIISTANSVIDEIKSQVEYMEARRLEIMTPINAVRDLVEKLFAHSGIKFGARLSFGDAATAVNSDSLSAGEKQLLSFICYNAFYKESAVFIDEPELSLHVDWQRQLFPILQSQGTSNQFILATHSPFIYGKYPDKEIRIDSDRGDSEE